MNQDDPGSDFTENGTARYDQEHTQTTSESGRRTSADADRPEKPNIFRQVAASSFMITYGLWAGFIMGYNAVGIPSFCRDDQRPFDMTIHSRSLFASTTNIAGLLGSLCSGLVPRRISGQTWFLICLLLPMCFLWILIAYSPVFPLMLAARALQGFFGSVYMAYSQVYTSEVAHKSSVNSFATLLATFPTGKFWLTAQPQSPCPSCRSC
jgi:MFS family permease